MTGIRRMILLGAAIFALCVAAPAGAATVTEFPVESNFIAGIAQAGDGTILYSGASPSGKAYEGRPESIFLGQVGPDGPLGQNATPGYGGRIAVGSEGDTWFGTASAIVRLTAGGSWSSVLDGLPFGAYISPAAAGGIWFTARNDSGEDHVGRVSSTGSVTLWSLPNKESGPGAIVEGSEGDAWFAEVFGERIGRVTASGQITEYALPHGFRPDDLTLGHDGNIWFDGIVNEHGEIGRITPAGKISLFALPTAVYAEALAAGPDGRIWFAEQVVHGGDPNSAASVVRDIGRIGPTGRYSQVPVPAPAADTRDLIAGAEGNMWFGAQGEPPCEGACQFHQYEKPAVVGRVEPGRLASAVAEPEGFVYRNRINVPISCSEGNVVQNCRGTIEVKVRGRIVGRDRYVVPVDYTRQWPAKRLDGVTSLLALTAKHHRAVAILHPDVGRPERRVIAVEPAP